MHLLNLTPDPDPRRAYGCGEAHWACKQRFLEGMEVGASLDVWGRWGSWSWGGQSEAGWDGPPGASILAGLSAKPRSSHCDAHSDKHRVTPSVPAGRGAGTLFCIPAAGWLAHLITVTDTAWTCLSSPLHCTSLPAGTGSSLLLCTWYPEGTQYVWKEGRKK